MPLDTFYRLSCRHSIIMATFGPYFSLGPVADNSFIRAANTTLVLPAVQTQHVDFLSLWPGMSTSTGHLIQAYTDSLSDPEG